MLEGPHPTRMQETRITLQHKRTDGRRRLRIRMRFPELRWIAPNIDEGEPNDFGVTYRARVSSLRSASGSQTPALTIRTFYSGCIRPALESVCCGIGETRTMKNHRERYYFGPNGRDRRRKVRLTIPVRHRSDARHPRIEIPDPDRCINVIIQLEERRTGRDYRLPNAKVSFLFAFSHVRRSTSTSEGR